MKNKDIQEIYLQKILTVLMSELFKVKQVKINKKESFF